MSSRRLPLLLGLLVVAGAGLALVLFASRGSGRVPPRLTWDQAIEGPSLMLGFLAERAQDPHGVPDWRKLPESGRHLWASLRFEHIGLAPQQPDADEPPPPSLADTAAAYEALGLADAASRIRALRDLRDAGKSATDAAVRAELARFESLRPRCEPARRAYATAHRAELDRPDYE